MKKILFYLLWFMGIAGLLVVVWMQFPADPSQERTAATATQRIEDEIIINEPILPIPLTIKQDPRRVALGQKLFHDPQLSTNNTISCSSCHILNQGGDDNKHRSLGILGQTGLVNAPTVYNTAFLFKQFWDGRTETLEDQVDGPTHDSLEMGSNWGEIIQKLKNDPEYLSIFQDIYPDGITPANIRNAIATFERTLITPNSRFDHYLRGDKTALTEQEKLGYTLFKEYGCTVCHQGIAAGGNMFQSFGKFGNYFEDRGNITKSDYGRMNVTGNENDRYKFKVPSLRNVELTAPYFHDASAKTLEDAVRIMAKYQLGVYPNEEEITAIVQFLNTLTGEYEGKLLKEHP